MCFAPQRRALFLHLNFQKWSETLGFWHFWLGNALHATTACTFSTSQLPKVVWDCRFLTLLTWKRASRHNGVHFFIPHLASWLRTRCFCEVTFRPAGATNHWKNTVNRDFPTFSCTCILSRTPTSKQPTLHRLHLVLTEASKYHPRQRDHPAYPGGSAIGLLWGYALDGEERPVWEVRPYKDGWQLHHVHGGRHHPLTSQSGCRAHRFWPLHRVHAYDAFSLRLVLNDPCILMPPNIRAQTRCFHHPQVYCTDIGTCEMKIWLQTTRHPRPDLLTPWMRLIS